MLLAIDVGNTNTVFALHDGKSFVAVWRLQTDAGRTADEYFVSLRQLMAFRDIAMTDIEAAICSSVAPKTVF